MFGGIDEWSCAWMAFFGDGMSRWVLVAFAEVLIMFTKGELYIVRWGSTNKYRKGMCLKEIILRAQYMLTIQHE